MLRELEKSRLFISRKVQALRKERRWTQAALSGRLQLSQSRLSEIERGDGSFSAEQLLAMLKLFNVPVSDFAPEPPAQSSGLQNALARLGALHLEETDDVLPSERLNDVGEVVREAIIASEFPRLVTGVAPVLVLNIDRINLKKLQRQLAEVGLERRLGWVVENTLEAIRREEPELSPHTWKRLYLRAQLLLESFLGFLPPAPKVETSAPDVLDTWIRSKQTLAEVAASSSPSAKRWGIVTTLQADDFAEALRGARAPRVS